MSVQRFTLDTTKLDDAGWGLDGENGFFLDTSLLDSTNILDGEQFLTVATATTILGALSATAQINVQVPSNAQATLNGLSGTASIVVKHLVTAQATLNSLQSTTTAVVKHSVSATSGLGSITATITSTAIIPVTGTALLGALVGTIISTPKVNATASAVLGGLNGSISAKSNVYAAGTANLNGLIATASATVITVSVPSSGGGRNFISPTIFVKPVIKVVEPEKIELPKPLKSKIKPLPKPVKTINAIASCNIQKLNANAFGSITWIAELDDMEVMELV